jgi:hypothetical protein
MDNEPRTMGLPADLVTQLADSITSWHLGPDDLLFSTRGGTLISVTNWTAPRLKSSPNFPQVPCRHRRSSPQRRPLHATGGIPPTR